MTATVTSPSETGSSRMRAQEAHQPGALQVVLAAGALALAGCTTIDEALPTEPSPSDSENPKVLHVAVVNEDVGKDQIEIGFTAAEPGETLTLHHCLAAVYAYDLPVDHWSLMVNGKVAIDSSDLADNFVGQDLIAQITVHVDGSLTQDRVEVGDFIRAPSRASVCSF